MDGFAIFLFIISLVLFVATASIILYNRSPSPSVSTTTNSGIPLPDSTMIGAQCPVGCTCFPNTDATMPSDKPTQFCGFLANDTMFSCPARCCQPTCINQDVEGIVPRVGN